VSCALVSACTASGDEVHPPQDQLFFPSGLAVSPDGTVLFVANSNSELRFDSGSIGVIGLDTVESVIQKWAPFPLSGDSTMDKPSYDGDCAPDPDHRETLICDAVQFLKIDAGVRIGNFATDIAMQNFGNNKLRLIVPTRGDPSIAWADFDSQSKSLSCDAGSTSFALCDDAHRLTTVQNNPDLPAIPDEPFGVFADPGPASMGGVHDKGFAIVTHLTSGAVTLIASPEDGNAQVADVKTNLFAQDQATGLRSATGVAGRTQGLDGDIVYVGSRTEDRIQTFTVGHPGNNTPPYLLPSNYFFLNTVGSTSGGSSDTRSMTFSSNGDRMYLVNRQPPSLQIFDTSLDTDGFPRNVGIGASDICRQASTVAVFGTGENERAYVTCFQDGEVYVVDPRGQSQVEDIITVGRGPYSVVVTTYQVEDPMDPTVPKKKIPRSLLFISNFLEDTIAVVDVTPTSPSRDRVVLRIGKPRAP